MDENFKLRIRFLNVFTTHDRLVRIVIATSTIAGHAIILQDFDPVLRENAESRDDIPESHAEEKGYFG